MARHGSSLVLLLLLLGCGTSVSETYLNGPPGTMSPRGRHSVLVYASGPPSRPHTDVAILEVSQTHGLNEQGLDIMIDRLRTRAAQIGCDGVVVGGIRERDGMPAGSAYFLLDPGATTLHGTCIVFTGRTATAKPARPAPTPPATDVRPSSGECSCGDP
jgi:hypothetical protein